jgi:hypothetical protein
MGSWGGARLRSLGAANGPGKWFRGAVAAALAQLPTVSTRPYAGTWLSITTGRHGSAYRARHHACDCEHSDMSRARRGMLSPPASSAAWGTCFGGVWSRRGDGGQRTSQALLGGRRVLAGPLAHRRTATYVAHAWICREAPHDPSIACGMCWRAGDCSSRSVKMASKSPPPHLHHQSS